MFITKNNIIGKNYKNHLEHVLLNDDLWGYLKSVVRQDLTENDESFAFTIFRHELLNVNALTKEPYLSLFCGLICNLCESFDVTDDMTILRIRAGMFLRKDKNIIHTPHVDFNHDHSFISNHFNIIYYFNTTNAPTYLYKETQKDFLNNVDFQEDPHIFASKYNFTKIDESLCLENTAIKFDGNNYHSSSSPTDSQYRITLNINVTKM